MEYKQDFKVACRWALIFVCLSYLVIGDGLALLYFKDPVGIYSNILKNLPGSMCAIVVRFCVAFVCLLTFPLTFVPAAQMIEQYLLNLTLIGARSYEAINDDSYDEAEFREPTMFLRVLSRSVLLVLVAVLAAYIPCFGLVVSFLGCFTVNILSFVLPPFFRNRLVTLPLIIDEHSVLNETHVSHSSIYKSLRLQYILDVVLTAAGIVLCIGTTTLTAFEISKALATHQGC